MKYLENDYVKEGQENASDYDKEFLFGRPGRNKKYTTSTKAIEVFQLRTWQVSQQINTVCCIIFQKLTITD